MSIYKWIGRRILLVSVAFMFSCCSTRYADRYESRQRGRNTRPETESELVATFLELPRINKNEVIVRHIAYIVSYNSTTLNPNWVAYELTVDETDGPWSRKGIRFMSDPDYEGRQADNDDYRNSGYSRGHLAPAGDMKWDSVAMVESFYFTNCIPQDAAFNNGKWNQLEEKTRRWAKQYGKVYVVCGPVYQNVEVKRIGQNGIAVPDACYKVLLIPLSNGDFSAIAFVMQNGGEERRVEECACTVDELEALLDMDFFCNLPDKEEADIESKVVWEDWGLR